MTPLDDRNWQPATFRERGAAVGFTSPLLAGARIRHAERRCELVVPHPGGARGVYIFAIGSLCEFCVPTLHDQRVAVRLAALRTLCPAAVREVARAVALEGASGRAAAAAARQAAAQDNEAASRAQTALFTSIVAQTGASGGIAPDLHATEAVLRLARRTGRDADAVRADITRLSNALARSGLDMPGLDGMRGRCARLLDQIAAMRTGILGWASAGAPDSPAVAFTQAASCMHAAGQRLLASTQALLVDQAALLQAWAANPDGVAARLGRVDWLLDGWEHFCLLWQLAETDDQRAGAAAELMSLLAPLPLEAEPWLGESSEALAPLRPRRAPGTGSRLSPRPPSQLVALIARNERIRAQAA